MSGTELCIVIALAVVAGMTGGVISTRYFSQYFKDIIAEKIRIRGKVGEAGAMLTLNLDGLPSLSFFDNDGDPRIVLGLLKNYEPNLTLYDRGSNPRTAFVQPNGEPAVLLYDRNNNPRFSLALFAGKPSLDFYDEDKKAIWTAPDGV